MFKGFSPIFRIAKNILGRVIAVLIAILILNFFGFYHFMKDQEISGLENKITELEKLLETKKGE